MVQLLYIMPGKSQYGSREKEPSTAKFSPFYWIKTSILSDGYGDLLLLMSHQLCLGKNHIPHGLTKIKNSEVNIPCVGRLFILPHFTKKSEVWLSEQGSQATLEKASSSCSKNTQVCQKLCVQPVSLTWRLRNHSSRSLTSGNEIKTKIGAIWTAVEIEIWEDSIWGWSQNLFLN